MMTTDQVWKIINGDSIEIPLKTLASFCSRNFLTLSKIQNMKFFNVL